MLSLSNIKACLNNDWLRQNVHQLVGKSMFCSFLETKIKDTWTSTEDARVEILRCPIRFKIKYFSDCERITLFGPNFKIFGLFNLINLRTATGRGTKWNDSPNTGSTHDNPGVNRSTKVSRNSQSFFRILTNNARLERPYTCRNVRGWLFDASSKTLPRLRVRATTTSPWKRLSAAYYSFFKRVVPSDKRNKLQQWWSTARSFVRLNICQYREGNMWLLTLKFAMKLVPTPLEAAGKVESEIPRRHNL